LNETWLSAYIELGHSYIAIKNDEEALKYYLKAIRIANLTNQDIKDNLVFQRAGSIYIEMEKWEDARVMFLMCAEQFKTSFSFFNLGVANYNLGFYDEAEKVLAMVNLMDSSNALTWAYLALSLLRKQSPPINSAYQCINESFKLGLSDVPLLQSIFVACLNAKQYRMAREV